MSTANARPRRTRPTAAPWRRRALRSAAPWAGAAALLVKAGPTPAQDAERGVRLFYATRSETGRPVGNCVACHASGEALILETAVVMAAKQRRSSVGAAFRATLATAEQSRIGDRPPLKLFNLDRDLGRLAAVNCGF